MQLERLAVDVAGVLWRKNHWWVAAANATGVLSGRGNQTVRVIT